MSPTLFSIFMDILAEKVEPPDTSEADSAIILFAEDVQLRARYRLSLQRDLGKAYTWAQNSDMTWNVSKCSTLQPEEDTVPLRMVHEQMKVSKAETYLGVTITRDRLTDALLKERVKSARAPLEMLKGIGLNAKGFGSKISRSMYLTFIRPMFEYCSHLVRVQKSTMQDVLALEKAFFNAATGTYKAPLPWFRKLFKLEDFPARRISLRDKMKVHMDSGTRIDANVLERALSKADNTAPSRYKEAVWNEADQHKVRKLPIPDPGLHLAFSLPQHKNCILSMKWFLHRLPASPQSPRGDGCCWQYRAESALEHPTPAQMEQTRRKGPSKCN